MPKNSPLKHPVCLNPTNLTIMFIVQCIKHPSTTPTSQDKFGYQPTFVSQETNFKPKSKYFVYFSIIVCPFHTSLGCKCYWRQLTMRREVLDAFVFCMNRAGIFLWCFSKSTLQELANSFLSQSTAP